MYNVFLEMPKYHKELGRKLAYYRSLVFRELHKNDGFKDLFVNAIVADPILHAKLLKVEDNCKHSLVKDPYFLAFLQSFGMRAGDIYFDRLVEMLKSGFKLEATDGEKNGQRKEEVAGNL
jgi:hypothetical protein